MEALVVKGWMNVDIYGLEFRDKSRRDGRRLADWRAGLWYPQISSHFNCFDLVIYGVIRFS